MPAETALADLLSLKGQLAIIAGGGGGLGRAIARRLLEAGARVVSVDRPGVESEPGAESAACDLADANDVRRLFDDLDDRYGPPDVVIHAAGITDDAVVWKMEDAAWSEVLRCNLDSAFLLVRAVVPRMRAHGGGSVVLVSSINGERGKFGQSNYAASKAGLNALARTVARETGRFGIRVNVVAPGFVETAMTRGLPKGVQDQAAAESALGRLGRPDDVARVVLFLATQASRHVTGQVLRVDGGQLIG